MIKKGSKGEVWFAYDAQGKERPFVIVSNDNVAVEVDHVIAKVTTQSPRNQFDVPIEDWKQSGLKRESIVRCSKLSTIHNQLLKYKVGDLSENDLERVLTTIRSYF